VRRLFSSFARGWPGIGLLLMRLVAAAVLTAQGLSEPHGGVVLSTILPLLAFCAAILLAAGLWTPIAGVTTALLEFLAAFSHAVDIWSPILLATDGIALALLGPGAWSVDARLCGWKRIEIGDPRG